MKLKGESENINNSEKNTGDVSTASYVSTGTQCTSSEQNQAVSSVSLCTGEYCCVRVTVTKKSQYHIVDKYDYEVVRYGTGDCGASDPTKKSTKPSNVDANSESEICVYNSATGMKIIYRKVLKQNYYFQQSSCDSGVVKVSTLPSPPSTNPVCLVQGETVYYNRYRRVEPINSIDGKVSISLAGTSAPYGNFTESYAAKSASNTGIPANWSINNSANSTLSDCDNTATCQVEYTGKNTCSDTVNRTLTASDGTNEKTLDITIHYFNEWFGPTSVQLNQPINRSRDAEKYLTDCDAYENCIDNGNGTYTCDRYWRCCGSSPTPPPSEETKCYRNQEGTEYEWTNNPKNGWVVVTDITDGESCIAPETKCYRNPEGTQYEWTNNPQTGWTEVTGVNEEDKCKPTYSLIIKKIDEGGNKLAGAVIGIYKDNEEIRRVTTTTSDIKIENLAEGTYKIKEISSPNNYVLDSNEYTVKVNNDGTIVPSEVTLVNNLMTEVRIHKLNADTSTYIDGVEFVIKDSNGNVVKKFTTGTESYNIRLPYGKYTIEEVSTPVSYIKNDETYEFTLDSTTSKVLDIKIYNKPYYTVKLIKQNASGERLAGAVFELLDSNNNVIREITSTDDYVLIDKLPKGEYHLREIKAPEGYALSKEVIPFSVQYTENVIEIVFFNEVLVPPTAKYVNYYILSAALLVLGLGFIAFYIKLGKKILVEPELIKKPGMRFRRRGR